MKSVEIYDLLDPDRLRSRTRRRRPSYVPTAPAPPAVAPWTLRARRVEAPPSPDGPTPGEVVRARRRRLYVPSAPAAAAPVVVQVSPITTGVTATPTITFSTPTTAGNLLVMFVAIRTAPVTAPTGWSTSVTAGLGPYIYAFYKTGAASGITSVAASAATGRWVAWAYEISGAAATTPIEATGKTDTGGSLGADGSGAVTTTSANDLVLAAIGATQSGTFAVSSGGFAIDRQLVGGATTVMAGCGLERTVSATGTYRAVTSGITSECGVILAITGVGGGVAFVPKFRKVLSALFGQVGRRQAQGINP